MITGITDKIRSLVDDITGDKMRLIKILSIAVILIMALILKFHNSGESDIEVENINFASESEKIVVDISGAVHVPGVYEVDNGTRLYEVIEMAGGLKENADQDSINQAAFVDDGSKIYIPIKYISDDEQLNIDNSIISGGSSVNGFININTASKDQLKTLDGIGDVMADRIIEYRSVNRFRKKEDIMSVKGIGSSIFEQIKDSIII